MKYKVISLLLCLGLLGASAGAVWVEAHGESRYHQHLDAPPKQEDRPDSGELSTHLPLVIIDTGGQEIPGKRGGENGDTVVSDDDEEDIVARMDIVDHEMTYNHESDEPTLSSRIRIHVRGRSSRYFDKSNFSIRLVDEADKNRDEEVMGMAKHHEWILHGPFLDQTLLRNYMWCNIGGEIMGYAPNVRFCEVVIDGEYKGVYVMMERLTAGVEKGTRIPLTAHAKGSTYGGYLLRINMGYPNDGINDDIELNNFLYYTMRTGFPVEILYPGAANLTPEVKRDIERDFSDFEKALYSYDYDGKKYGYKATVNIQSFLDYFLIMEVTCNYDAGELSTYIAKDVTGKMHMYLWDMNNSCDNYAEDYIDVEDFRLQTIEWYFMMMKDEDFTDALIHRYWELRKTYLDPDYLVQYIDDTVAYLGDAVDRNYQVWGYTFEEGRGGLQPEERNHRSYEESVDQLKRFLVQRIAWMDENIETLRQYSTESRVKKFNENAN